MEPEPLVPAESLSPQDLIISFPRMYRERCVQNLQVCLWGREGPDDPEMLFSGANTEQGKGRLSLAQ